MVLPTVFVNYIADAAKQRAGGFDLHHNEKSDRKSERSFQWEQRESNPRPSACKADALNQLSYAPKHPVSNRTANIWRFFLISKVFGENLLKFPQSEESHGLLFNG